jgi:hypothetical protein
LIFVSPSLPIEHWISLLSFLNFLAADFVAAFYVVFVAAFLADAFFALIESRALNCRPKGRDHRRKRGRSSRFLVDSRPTQGKRREGLCPPRRLAALLWRRQSALRPFGQGTVAFANGVRCRAMIFILES